MATGGAAPAAAAGGRRRGSIGMAVSAVPTPAMSAVLASLQHELDALGGQYRALCDAAARDGQAGAALAAEEVYLAMEEKERQIALLAGAEPGVVAPPERSPLRNPGFAAKRVDALRTLHHLRELAVEAVQPSSLEYVARVVPPSALPAKPTQ
jgi:hypothetical protein